MGALLPHRSAVTKELEPVARAEAPAAATEAPPPSAAVAETPSPASKVEAPVSRVPVRPAEWNPQGLGVPLALPVPGGELFAKQFVPEYLNAGPAYLGFSEGTLPGCIGFDPWALSVLAKPELSPQALQALDKTSRTAAERNERMLALSPEEQQEKVLWMRSSELKHGRLAMLAAAGWPMAEMLNGNALFSTGGRAPSLFNGGLPEYLPFLLVFLGGLSALEVNTKDTSLPLTSLPLTSPSLALPHSSLSLSLFRSTPRTRSRTATTASTRWDSQRARATAPCARCRPPR